MSPKLGATRERLAGVRGIQSLVTRALERVYGIVDTERNPDDPVGEGERVKYLPSGWFRLLVALPRRDVGCHDVFADLGSGKGRVVLQAAMIYPFKRVIGVEIVEDLNAIARANVERNRARLRARDVEIVTADVLEWELPEDLTIVYLYNPVVGERFERLVERLAALVNRRQRPLRLIYVKPTQHERLLAMGGVRELPPPRGMLARLRGVPPSQLRLFEIRPLTDQPGV